MSAVSVPARIHLAGNPSDGYGGAVLSTTVPDFAATVEVELDDAFTVTGPAPRWPTIDHLSRHAARHGHDDGGRLVTAALVTLDRHLPADLDRRPGRFRWSTTIPRSVGLAGSSALVLATMRAALRWWAADDVVDDLTLARLALETEVADLGIAAGLADRTVQAAGGVVLTDCRDDEPTFRTVVVTDPLSLTLLWNEAAAAPSGDYHRRLRRELGAGDAGLTEAMGDLAGLAVRAAAAVEEGRADDLGTCMDDSLRLRCRLGPVPADALAPVEDLRRGGHRVNFTGSGGALVVLGRAEPPPGWEARPIVIERVSPAPAPSPSTPAGPSSA